MTHRQSVVRAEKTVVALLTAAAHDLPELADLSAEVAAAEQLFRMLVAFGIIETCAAHAAPGAETSHPVLGPAMTALREDDPERVRAVLRGALTGKDPAAYGRLVVQLAWLTAELVPALPQLMTTRGLNLARLT